MNITYNLTIYTSFGGKYGIYTVRKGQGNSVNIPL
jgi:hypothetical protein